MQKIYSNPLIYLLLIMIMGLFLQCGRQPLSRVNQFKNSKDAPRLQEAWKHKLALLADNQNKAWLQENICKLDNPSRESILEIIQAIAKKDQQRIFLESLASFNAKEQAHLLGIMLHLKKLDQSLMLKIASCHTCLTFLEKIKFYQLENELPEKCQKLLEEFEENLKNNNK